jgi:hypothetical protein
MKFWRVRSVNAIIGQAIEACKARFAAGDRNPLTRHIRAHANERDPKSRRRGLPIVAMTLSARGIFVA